jgi:arylsulfatase A-like enzyme
MVRSVDLMPTLLAWLGIEAPGDLDGVDLNALIEGGADHFGAALETAYTEQNEYLSVRAVRTKDWLLVRHAPKPGVTDPAVRLYRRGGGRAASEDVAARHPEVRERLLARLAELHDVDDPGESIEIPVPEGAREQLRALGYLTDE